MSGGRLLLMVASAVMLVAVLSGLHVVGSPAHQRKLRMDDERVFALSMASGLVHHYGVQHNALPDDLSATSIQARWHNDPATGKPCIYNQLSKDSCSLCAAFDVASDGQQQIDAPTYQYVPFGVAWRHPAGPHCFQCQAGNQGEPQGMTILHRAVLPGAHAGIVFGSGGGHQLKSGLQRYRFCSAWPALTLNTGHMNPEMSMRAIRLDRLFPYSRADGQVLTHSPRASFVPSRRAAGRDQATQPGTVRISKHPRLCLGIGDGTVRMQ